MNRAYLILTLFSVCSATSAQQFVWGESFGSSGAQEIVATAVDAQGNSYSTGYFQDTVDFDPGPGVFNMVSVSGQDMFILKLDPDGQLLWAKQVGAPLYIAESRSLSVSASGNIYVCGRFSDTLDFDPGPDVFDLTLPPAAIGAFLLALNPNGDFVFADAFIDFFGSDATAVTVDSHGNILLTGTFDSTIDVDPGPGTLYFNYPNSQHAMFTVKLKPDGSLIWGKSIGASFASVQNDAITTDAFGNVITGGQFHGSVDFDPGPGLHALFSLSSHPDMDMLALDSAGNYLWADALSGLDFEKALKSLVADGHGNIYATGFYSGKVDFDPGPDSLNLASWGSNDNYQPDLFVIRVDSLGHLSWAKSIGQESYSQTFGYSIALDTSANVYMAGMFQGTVDFDPGPDSTELSFSNIISDDGFVLKLTPFGDFVWAESFNSDGSQCLAALDSFGNIYVSGEFATYLDCDPSAATYMLTGEGDMFITKWASVNLGIGSGDLVKLVRLYPNPSNGPVTLDVSAAKGDATVELLTSEGVLLSSVKTRNNETLRLDISDRPTGVYLVKLLTRTDAPIICKLVKE